MSGFTDKRRSVPSVPPVRGVALGLFLSALVGLSAVGCATHTGRGGADGVENVEATLELTPPSLGVQIETLGVVVDAGDDVRWCEVVVVPGAASAQYAVDRIETAMSAHGRELVLAVAERGSQTEAIMEDGARVPCLRAGEVFGEELRIVAATEQPYQDQRYPDGVGRVFRGGDRLVVEYHFVNDSAEPVAAKAKVNLHVTTPGAVAHLANTASFDNLTIYTPPAGSSAHMGECSVSQRVVVGELMRRTRHFGTDFRVWIAGGERDGELVWYSGDHRDTQLELAEPIVLMPGEGFRFQCSFVNRSNEDLRAGTSASDERCGLLATFWTADATETAEPQSCLLLDVDLDGVARGAM